MSKHILIVDDESLIRFALARSLQSNHITVKAVSTGEGALSAVSSLPYDLCLLDIHLSDANGLEIMKQIRTLSPQTKILIMTGSELDAALRQSIEKYACGIIAKPFDLAQLKAVVKNALDSGTTTCST
ncbi:MAG: response regulator [Nitrospirota bacterium]